MRKPFPFCRAAPVNYPSASWAGPTAFPTAPRACFKPAAAPARFCLRRFGGNQRVLCHHHSDAGASGLRFKNHASAYPAVLVFCECGADLPAGQCSAYFFGADDGGSGMSVQPRYPSTPGRPPEPIPPTRKTFNPLARRLEQPHAQRHQRQHWRHRLRHLTGRITGGRPRCWSMPAPGGISTLIISSS